MRRRSNSEWVAALQSSGPDQAEALSELRTYLLRGALFTLRRARHHVSHLGPGALDALAEDCAQEALAMLLQRLHSFRGESKFTTWAYAFAVNIALTAARRERWASVSLDRVIDGAAPLSATLGSDDSEPNPEQRTLQAEVRAVVRAAISEHLTIRQQQALQALIIEQVPLDEIVRHWGSNRNAVYKLVHDARLKLKRHLANHGFDVKDVLDLFRGAG